MCGGSVGNLTCWDNWMRNDFWKTETQSLAKRNLSAIGHCTFDVILCTHTGSRIFTMRMINSGGVRIPCWWLFLFMLTHNRTASESFTKSQLSQSGSVRKRSPRIDGKFSSVINTALLTCSSFLRVSRACIQCQLLAIFAYFLLIGIWFGRKF